MGLMPVEEAISRIVASAIPLNSELVTTEEAGQRVLADPLTAKLTQPPFNASAMDGYAIRAADALTHQHLRLIGIAAAGHDFPGYVNQGEAVRIMTGAPVPNGADTVIIQENTRKIDETTIEILEPVAEARNIRFKGYDFHEGQMLLHPGLVLRSRHIMLAAAMNHAVVPVRRKPRIAILPTGDELVSPGGTPGPSQIISSVPAGLKAALESWGAQATVLNKAQDNRDHLAAAIEKGRGADVLVTIGGASVGDHDHVHDVLAAMGARFEVIKVAIRPGKPLMFGTFLQQHLMNLPGNPVSALVCARVFLKPLINKLLGMEIYDGVLVRPLAQALDKNGDREHYMRGLCVGNRVKPLLDQDSSLMLGFATADCLIKRLPHDKALDENDDVTILTLNF